MGSRQSLWASDGSVAGDFVGSPGNNQCGISDFGNKRSVGGGDAVSCTDVECKRQSARASSVAVFIMSSGWSVVPVVIVVVLSNMRIVGEEQGVLYRQRQGPLLFFFCRATALLP